MIPFTPLFWTWHALTPHTGPDTCTLSHDLPDCHTITYWTWHTFTSLAWLTHYHLMDLAHPDMTYLTETPPLTEPNAHSLTEPDSHTYCHTCYHLYPLVHSCSTCPHDYHKRLNIPPSYMVINNFKSWDKRRKRSSRLRTKEIDRFVLGLQMWKKKKKN